MKRMCLRKLLIAVILIIGAISACSEKAPERSFVIPSDKPAMALTIGWYVPVGVLSKLVGPEFKPKVVNDKNEAEIMLRIIQGDEHKGDGVSAGMLKMANLVIPVEFPESMKPPEGMSINGVNVCPLCIVDKSEWLGNRLDSLGFATYSGKIDLNVKQSDKKYIVEAKIETSNGSIDINGIFDEGGESKEMTIANFTPKYTSAHYYYGEERMTRRQNGKGNLNLKGQNIISAMNLGHQPYFLKLDTDLVWDLDFVK